MTRARRASLTLLLVGLGGAIAMVAWHGVDAVFGNLAAGGWGLLGMIPLYGPPLLVAVLAWWVVFPPDTRPRFAAMLYAGWIAQAINALLPVAQVGGEVVKARLITGGGISGPLAGAASVVDKTAQAVAQLLAALVGMALLATVAGGKDEVLLAMAAATALLAVLIYAFYRVQKVGLFPLLAGLAQKLASLGSGKRAGDPLSSLVVGADSMQEAIRTMYGHRRAILLACVGKLANRLLLSAEIWLALWVMGYPVSVSEALLLETLNQTARSAAFFVPSAFGIQEGGYVLIGMLIGLPPSLALALSLARRGREMATGIPALVAWYLTEIRTLLKRADHRQ